MTPTATSEVDDETRIPTQRQVPKKFPAKTVFYLPQWTWEEVYRLAHEKRTTRQAVLETIVRRFFERRNERIANNSK